MNKTKTDWCTPEHNTEKEITDLNLTPIHRDLVLKKILTANVIISEIAATKHGSALKKRSMLHRVVSGKLAQKKQDLSQGQDSSPDSALPII